MKRRIAKVRLSGTALSGMLGGHEMSRVETDWPADAEIVDAWWDRDRGQICLAVISSAFDPVEEGSCMPEWAPMVTSETDLAAELVNMVHRDLATGS